jgi:heme exporter protein A
MTSGDFPPIRKKKITDDITVNDITINIDSVSKAFGTRLVLKNISLAVAARQSVLLCGVNGAGKSTLLGIIAGLLQPDSGSVSLLGYNIDRYVERAKSQLGVILHKPMVYPELTVAENLSFFADLYGVKKSSGRINDLLEEVGIWAYRYDRAGILSHGLLRRLAIARALVHSPKILLADEPFTGLDSDSCEHLISVLINFADNSGTVLMTTHNTHIGLQCCRRVLVLDKASLIFDADAGDVDSAGFSKDFVAYARGAE